MRNQQPNHGDLVQRARVTDCLLRLAGLRVKRSVCILGAEQLDLVELKLLLRRFTTVHLVGLDRQLIGDQIDGQHHSRGIPTSINVYAPIDVGGIGSLEPPRTASQAQRFAKQCGRLIEHNWLTSGKLSTAMRNECADAVAFSKARPFDAIASIGIASQLVRKINRCFAEEHAAGLRSAMVSAHLGLMASLLAPSGRAVLVTDFRESRTTFDGSGVCSGYYVTDRLDELHPTAVRLHLCDHLRRQVQGVTQSEIWEWETEPCISRACYATYFESAKRSFAAFGELPERIRKRLK